MEKRTQSVVLRAGVALIIGFALVAGLFVPGAAARTGVSAVPPAPALQTTQVGQVSVSCTYYAPNDRAFSVSLEDRGGGPPSGTITYMLYPSGQRSEPFTGNSLSIRGAYISIRIEARWPDGATGFAESTCESTGPTPTATRTPGPTRTPRPTITPGGPTATPRPPRTPTPTRTPGPSPTRNPTRTATPTVMPDQAHNIEITCDYFSDRDRRFTVTLGQPTGDQPSGTATLGLVDGGEEVKQFTGNSLEYRGPYITLRVVAAWPDGYSGSASATCGQQIPATDTPTPTDTPTTPSVTDTPTPTETSTTPSVTDTPTTPSVTETPTTTPVIPTPPSDNTPTATGTTTITETATPTETVTTPPTGTATSETPPPPPGSPPGLPAATPTPRRAVAGATDEDQNTPPRRQPRAILSDTGADDGMRIVLTLTASLLAMGAAVRVWQYRRR